MPQRASAAAAAAAAARAPTVRACEYASSGNATAPRGSARRRRPPKPPVPCRKGASRRARCRGGDGSVARGVRPLQHGNKSDVDGRLRAWLPGHGGGSSDREEQVNQASQPGQPDGAHRGASAAPWLNDACAARLLSRAARTAALDPSTAESRRPWGRSRSRSPACRRCGDGAKAIARQRFASQACRPGGTTPSSIHARHTGESWRTMSRDLALDSAPRMGSGRSAAYVLTPVRSSRTLQVAQLGSTKTAICACHCTGGS